MNYNNGQDGRYDHHQSRHGLAQGNSVKDNYENNDYYEEDKAQEQNYEPNQQSPHRNHPHDERYNMTPPEGMEGDAYDVPRYGLQDYRKNASDDEDRGPEEEGVYQQQTDEDDEGDEGAAGAEDAILDLEELEQLQEEAERMKGLGNKHMAAQVSVFPCVNHVSENFRACSFCRLNN